MSLLDYLWENLKGEVMIRYHLLPNDIILYLETMIQEFKKQFQIVDDLEHWNY